ncbi:hypothetical protein SsS58_04532 [Streptomyces scabiei]|uniref:DUF4244 domain-containing protein n=3 Tax=Streptomyces TaxID=1883 RepID=A0A100JR25_STRSC|nr:hypothetical protein SsS58_04532 [Streptomyces scabiei]
MNSSSKSSKSPKSSRVSRMLGSVQAAGEVLRAWLVCAVMCRVRAARRDAGMVTSEYAVGIIAAVAFAAVLYKVVTSGQVQEELQQIVGRALNGGA